MLDLAAALEFAQTAADGASKLALSHFRQALSVEHKADDSPVTIADRGIETFLRDRISAHYPDHGIYGEEHGTEGLDRRFVWVIDPIDGTKSFVTGHPLFGGLMALLDDGTPRLGQIDMPATGERWCGVEGQRSTLNGSPIRTSGCTDLAQAYAYTTDPMLFSGPRAPIFTMLRDRVRLLRFGGDCYNYALLASGYCDLVLECGLEPYDYLPVVQIVQGAGGCISDWHGNSLHTGSSGDVVASASPYLHSQILDELARLRATQAA
ncbi:histidinol-phosphatase, inositol monophosphatase family [Poseidonocella pacifica]|uniref:Histidinol-phosphatase n=1 Tax=Poseidonocella pacifica TaxID=871651 RepID=A0A1I0WIG8_9RHOB|nr:histidinol-phosphatase [Poseidonocella pacifica]SFA88028.1 histidinol-phosphatase, inositol monophosphatase family [Poseidonocella pacifica]